MDQRRVCAVILILLSFPLLAIAQGLPQRVTALEAKVAELEAKVAQHHVPDCSPRTALFGDCDLRLQSPVPLRFGSSRYVRGLDQADHEYRRFGGGFICRYALQIPDGSGGWIEQIRVRCDCGASCDPTVVPVISDTMRLSTGTASGSLTAAGLLENNRGVCVAAERKTGKLDFDVGVTGCS